MHDWIVAHEALVRFGAFAIVLAALLALEALAARRRTDRQRALRWPANFTMAAACVVLVRLLLPLGATGTALWAGAHGMGLFNQVALPSAIAAVLSFLALDAVIYGQHRLFHRFPLFWRFHRMHHSDIEFDATTALRFHPLEIVLSMLIKMGAVLILGAPVMGVIAFEIALNGVAMFNHSNLALPAALDRALRRFVVTPDMHRVHHSIHGREYNSNFGFNLPWWDHLFRSYTDQPADGHATMQIGLRDFRAPEEQGVVHLLLLPLKD